MKIRAFVAEIFAKQYWYFLIIDFQCIFYISAIIHIRSPPRWIITEWWWNCFEIRPQNLPISVKWKHQFQLIFCILRPSHKHTDFDSSWGTPCSIHLGHKYRAWFQKNSPLAAKLLVLDSRCKTIFWSRARALKNVRF